MFTPNISVDAFDWSRTNLNFDACANAPAWWYNSRRGRQGRTPRGPNSFIFMQFSGKKLKNISTFGNWRTPLRKILDPTLQLKVRSHFAAATTAFFAATLLAMIALFTVQSSAQTLIHDAIVFSLTPPTMLDTIKLIGVSGRRHICRKLLVM